jgi:NitT/TauT family transport system permease protein
LSSETLDYPPPEVVPHHGLVPPARPARWGVGAAVAVLSPAALALVALGVHNLLRTRQKIPLNWLYSATGELHPYPVVLRAVLAASLLLAGIAWAWRPMRPWARHYAPLLAGLLGVFAAWDLATLKTGWLRMPFFPGPDMVLASLVEDRQLLMMCTWESLRLLLAGYALGVAAGLVSGVLIGWFPRVRYWGMPALKLVGPVPATALIAVAMTFFASAFLSGAVLIAYAVWFPVTMLTASGIANVRLSYLDVARTLGAGRAYLIFRVALPSALPNVFLGMFMGLTASFLTLIVAEAVGVKAGLGWYVGWQQGYIDYTKVYAALLIMSVFFSTLMTLLFKLRDQLLKWQKGVIRW